MKRNINFLVLGILATIVFASCSDKYSISGTSLQSLYGANMAFLKSTEDAHTVDSCSIVHGKFNMSGILDSVECVELILGNMSVPVVLEQGEIKVSFEDSSLKVSGTPLNEKFFRFLTSRDSITMLLNELPSKESAMILDGMSEDQIYTKLGEEEADLRAKLEKKDCDFITSNYHNILGVTWFLNLCSVESSKYGYPTTSPMLDELYGKAPEEFRNNKEVVEFIRKANGK